MNKLIEFIFAPGFFQSTEVMNALTAGVVTAAVSGIVGVFVILRGQSLASHAVSDFGGTGAAAAFLLGINSLWGFIGFGTAAAVCMEFLGNRFKERDLATGIVLSVALGVEALFLYFDTNLTGKANAPMTVLFGSVFLVDRFTIHMVILITAIIIIIFLAIYRPLLMCSIDYSMAFVRGIKVSMINFIFIILMSLVVEEDSIIVGALLSTALVIGPAAAAIRITDNIKTAMLISAVLGSVSIILGVILSYDSYHWPPFGRGWPVSFFVSVIILGFYLVVRFYKEFLKPIASKHRGVVAHYE